MTNPTRDQLIDAWDAIDRLATETLDVYHYHQHLDAIKTVLPERPRPTMAETGWDDKYFLAEAEILGGYGDEVVMLYGQNTHGSGTGIVTNAGVFDPCQLTPTGRKYKFVLDDGHLEYLETEQDYEDAPDGTIVVLRPGGLPAIKHGSIWKSFTWFGSAERMSGDRRRVLRWGWGDDA